MLPSTNHRYIRIVVDRQKLQQTLVVLPTLIIVLTAITFAIGDMINANLVPQTEPVLQGNLDVQRSFSYPASGSELNPNLFAVRLPPPPLDALPYDVRHPLSNGLSVPVKRRWLWIPPGASIIVSDDGTNVEIPEGSLWWKEFYLETDRGSFLIERRIIARVRASSANPDGWAFYSSHHLSPNQAQDTPIILSSTGDAFSQYVFQPTDWLPTQSETMPVEVRFEDARGLQYPYLFPGQTQCMVCHSGAAGAYPNSPQNPIFVFGLHPNNLTSESFKALVERGWIRNGERLLTEDYPGSNSPNDDVSIDALTREFVGIVRNNCASCHNSSPHAQANFTAFILDPNHNYSASELMEVLSATGRMATNPNPLVTPGQLNASEIWLRVNGLEGRRRMPPREGGLPDLDPRIVDLMRTWIMKSVEY